MMYKTIKMIKTINMILIKNKKTGRLYFKGDKKYHTPQFKIPKKTNILLKRMIGQLKLMNNVFLNSNRNKYIIFCIEPKNVFKVMTLLLKQTSAINVKTIRKHLLNLNTINPKDFFIGYTINNIELS